MRVREVMTADVVTVGPATSVKDAGELMSANGYAALPVLDDDGALVGIVAEADVLRDRLPRDPRLHLRRDTADRGPVPVLVGEAMTEEVRWVDPGADVADVARLFVDERLRSVPVVQAGRLVGIVSRRDLLRTVVRPDEEIARDLQRLVEGYTGEPDAWDIRVTEGVATIRRARGLPDGSAADEEGALSALAHTVGGLVGVHVAPPGPAAGADTAQGPSRPAAP